MSKRSPQRAEGCGQWLSAKNKRPTKLPLQTGGKGKKIKHKALLNFATSKKRNGGLDIQVSCSPLSPRTRNKLKNAKQSKINKYFEPAALTNDSKSDKNKGFASKTESLLAGKQTRISVKRLRHDQDQSFGGKIYQLHNGILNVIFLLFLQCCEMCDLCGNTRPTFTFTNAGKPKYSPIRKCISCIGHSIFSALSPPPPPPAWCLQQ